MKSKQAQMQPMNQQPVVEKKSKLWIWILLIIVLLVVVGLGIWFMIGGDGGSSLGLGSSIPRPPALPE